MSRVNDQRPMPEKGAPPRSDGYAPETVSQRRARYRTAEQKYFADNPKCAEENCGLDASEYHHIARGNARQSSLTNTDLGMGGCNEHHKQWDDKGKTPVAKQFAIKFKASLRRYRELYGQQVAIADVVKFMQE